MSDEATIIVKDPDFQTSWCLTTSRSRKNGHLALVTGIDLLLKEKSAHDLSDVDSINFNPIGVKGGCINSGFEIPVTAAVEMAYAILELAKVQTLRPLSE